MKRALLLLSLLAAGTAGAAPVKLILSSTAYTIQKAELQKQPIVKSWTVPSTSVATSKKVGRLSTTITPILDQMERQINARRPAPALFRNVNGHWIAQDRSGWIFDRDGTKANLMAAIRAGKSTAQVKFREVVPQRSVRELARRGVLWHLSTGSSSFRGSPDFRVTNVVVGATKLDNFFIAPGHVFDFNREIGQVEASTGFVKGFVISGGTLSKEDGGGICQVSTTIFRALYQAGLPIVERHEHSHVVHYYDPVGFEATVYAPSKNLRMKNDTGKYIFVQASWNRRTQTLRFDLFGANTGRTVSISRPVLSAFKAAPQTPTYTPDTRVRLGARRVLDLPMRGVTSVITRTIKVNGKVISKDQLKSVYQPWARVYGVHPQDPRL